MKNKIKMKTMLIALMIMLVPLTSSTTQAWTTYTFTRTQSPYEENVRVGDIVVISIDRDPDSGDEMNLVLARGGLFSEIETKLWFTRTDSSGSIVEKNTAVYPDQTLPTLQNPITFTIGPFNIGDTVQYNIWLVLKYATDYDGTPCSSFVVQSEDTPLVPDPYVELEWPYYVLIGVGVLVVLLGLAYVYKKRRGI